MKLMTSCKFMGTRVKLESGKALSLTLILLFSCLCGCSGDDRHDFNMPGKIHIDAKRWYLLNNTANGFDQLFNGISREKPNTGYGTILENFDAWYPLFDGESMSIDSIMMYDYEGTNADHPLTIFAVNSKWEKVPIAVFTGNRYNTWNGPDPKNPDRYTLQKSVTDIRYLVINSWGDYPGEIEFYGKYTPPKSFTPVPNHYFPLKNFLGVNAFEWDFENPTDPGTLDPVRLTAIKNFTGIRHYLDWDKIEAKEGSFSFNPATGGGWNYDTMYHWCKANNIEVLTCLKTLPPWIQATYPVNQRDNEDIPIRFGKDPGNPSSYIEQAKAGFQFAARYGNNKNINPALLHIDPDNVIRFGLGTVHYIECDNERDKWWKGREAYQTGREYAANLSAFYDGNKNTMGSGIGVKNADSTMLVVMAGLAAPDPGYVMGMIDWCKQFRGYKPDGNVDLPWDVINYHYYSNNANYISGKKQSSGTPPELSTAAEVAQNFMKLAHNFAHDMPVWITEAGYDIDQRSPQRAPVSDGKSALFTQANWILRTSLLYARCGIQKVFYYELMDDNPKLGTQFATSGLINADRSARPAADFLAQVNNLFGNYSYDRSLSTDPIVDKYTYNSTSMYMLVQQKTQYKKNYSLDLGNAPYAFIYTPVAGSKKMQKVKKETMNGKIEIQIKDTPQFVTTLNIQ